MILFSIYNAKKNCEKQTGWCKNKGIINNKVAYDERHKTTKYHIHTYTHDTPTMLHTIYSIIIL